MSSRKENAMDHRLVADIIRRATGIVLEEDKFPVLERIVESRLAVLGVPFTDYTERMLHDHDEIVRVASEFTVQETSFYRNREHFAALKNVILPELIRKRRFDGNLRLDILSAGCATGEEPYTLAMLLLDLLPDFQAWELRITGLDICGQALEDARTGVYSRYKMRNIDRQYIDRFFHVEQGRVGENYRISDRVRKMVEFRHCNLLGRPSPLEALPPQDVILCENVIIYFDNASIEKLMDQYFRRLTVPGYLFLGYSETLGMVRHRFQVKWIGNAYFYVKETGDAPLSAGFDQSLLGAVQEKDSCLYRQAREAYQGGDERQFSALLETWQKEAMLHDSSPDDVAFAVLAAEFFLDRGDVYSTLQYCQQAISRNPSSPEAHLVASLAYLENGLDDQARLELETARYLDPDSWLVSWIGYRLGGGQAAAGLRKAARLYNEKKRDGGPGFPASMARRERIEQELASGESDEMG